MIAVSGDRAENGPEQVEDFPLPAAGTTRRVRRGRRSWSRSWGPRRTAAGRTVYVVEPHGKSVFADHELPFAPAALALDHNKDYPTTSHGSLLAFGAGGEAASMDVGSYALAWRLPGAIMGALTVAVLFLLGTAPLLAAGRGRARRPVRGPGRDVLRPEPDRDERRLHRLLHPGRVPAVRLDVAGAGTREALVLDRDARHGRAPGPGARVQVGRRLRDRRARDPGARSDRRWAGSC